MTTRYFRILTVLALAFVSQMSATGHARYATRHSGFASLMSSVSCQATLEGDYLIDSNIGSIPVIVTDSCEIPSSAFSYAIRFSNLNTKRGKSQVTSADGSKRDVPVSQCGIVWDYVDADNYWAAVAGNYNTAYRDDLTDRCMTSVEVIRCVGGRVTVMAACQVPVVAENTRDRNSDADLMTLRADVSNEQIKVSIGKRELEPIITLTPKRRVYRSRVGYYVGPGAKLKLERAMSSWTTDDGTWRLMTEWNEQSLRNYFAQSIDPMEGFWEYLDRDTDDRTLRLGGKYRIALVQNDGGGYDIIYIDGAQVARSQWDTGLLKGRLEKTVFSGTYKAVWIDATFQPFTDEVQATIDEGIILTVRFPVYNNSQIRFSKEAMK